MFLTICTQVSVYSTSTVVCTSGFKMNIRNCSCIYQSTKTNKWNKKAISKVNGIGDINTVDFRMIYIKWKLHVIKFGVQKKREIADNIRLIFVKIQWQAYQTFAWLLPLFFIKILIIVQHFCVC